MEEFLDPSLNSHAYKYAFTSAMREYLDDYIHRLKLKTKVHSAQNSSSDYMDEDEIRGDQEDRELILSFEQVTNEVLSDIMKYHLKEDVHQSRSWGYPSLSLSYHFEKVLLRNPVIDSSPKISTSDLVSSATRGVNHNKYVLDRLPELASYFYDLLRKTFKYHLKFLWAEQTREDAIRLNLFVARFLSQCSQEYKYLLQYRPVLRNQLGIVVQELQTQSTIPIEDAPLGLFYSGFELMLRNQLDLNSSNDNLATVRGLRELGNNLMVGKAYAQAIKVYTEAISICQFQSILQVPQLLINRAIAFIGLTCFREAINDLNLCIQYDVTSVPAWVQLAYAQLYMGNSLLSLKLYSIALKCCCGEILPYNFPKADAAAKQGYQHNKVLSVLPQFVEQILNSVKLTEVRAVQQRISLEEIDSQIHAIKRSCTILLRVAKDEDKRYFNYPPDSSTPSTFREIAQNINQERPGMFTYEASQGVVATAEVPAELGTERVSMNSNGPSFTTRSNPTTAPTRAAAANENTREPSLNSGAGRALMDIINPPPEPRPTAGNNGNTDTPTDRRNRVLDFTDLVRDYMTSGVSNMVALSLGGLGGNPEVVITTGPFTFSSNNRAPNSDNTPTPRAQNEYLDSSTSESSEFQDSPQQPDVD